MYEWIRTARVWVNAEILLSLSEPSAVSLSVSQSRSVNRVRCDCWELENIDEEQQCAKRPFWCILACQPCLYSSIEPVPCSLIAHFICNSRLRDANTFKEFLQNGFSVVEDEIGSLRLLALFSCCVSLVFRQWGRQAQSVRSFWFLGFFFLAQLLK